MKSRWTGFRSILACEIQMFLENKRILGRKYVNEERALRLFDQFLVEQRVICIEQVSTDMVERFLVSRHRTRPRSFNHLLGVLRRLLDWLVVQGAISSSPLRMRPRRVTVHRLPFIFDVSLARRLLEAAGNLSDRPRAPQRGLTYRTIFALLYGLGLRVGEASHLQCGDVDMERALLVVRGGKFGKTRLVPFGPRMGCLLKEQLARRADQKKALDRVFDQAPFFTFDGQRAVNPCTVSQTFLRLTRLMKLPLPAGASPPRLHDLRHSFAVGTLLRWYREGLDPAANLHHLSTFLGHVDPVSTAVYLTITDDLLREGNRRFEAFAEPAWREDVS